MKARRFYGLTLADRLYWRSAPSDSPTFAARRRLVEALQAASPYQSARAPEPLPSLPADATRDDFLAASDHYRRPVVIRGFARHTPATRDWDLPYLRERLSDQTCTVLLLDDAVKTRDWDVPAPVLQMPFSDYFDRMSSEPLYLNSSTEIAHLCPPLMQDLRLDRLTDRFQAPDSAWDELVLTNFFIGSDQVYSAIHAAPAGNFFLNVLGRKRWTLTDPALSPYLFPVTKPPFQSYRSAYGGYRAAPDSILFKLPRFEVTLAPGDLLYNAPWWWHEVDNLDPVTVGVSVRRTPAVGRADATWHNHRLFTLTSIYPAGRLAVAAHALYQRVSGDPRPLRDFLNVANTRIQERTLRRAR